MDTEKAGKDGEGGREREQRERESKDIEAPIRHAAVVDTITPIIHTRSSERSLNVHRLVTACFVFVWKNETQAAGQGCSLTLRSRTGAGTLTIYRAYLCTTCLIQSIPW